MEGSEREDGTGDKRCAASACVVVICLEYLAYKQINSVSKWNALKYLNSTLKIVVAVQIVFFTFNKQLR